MGMGWIEGWRRDEQSLTFGEPHRDHRGSEGEQRRQGPDPPTRTCACPCPVPTCDPSTSE